ncbi:MAG: tRNA (guanosine(37)-N1)-methyltransferase TrmD, partial [Acetobacteraceae bacterium]
MTWRASVLTLFPEMFPGPLGQSLAGRALEAGLWSLQPANIRDFTTDRHRSVDDTPFGGGAGMVMRPDVVDAAVASVADGRALICLTPRGRPFV